MLKPDQFISTKASSRTQASIQTLTCLQNKPRQLTSCIFIIKLSKASAPNDDQPLIPIFPNSNSLWEGQSIIKLYQKYQKASLSHHTWAAQIRLTILYKQSYSFWKNPIKFLIKRPSEQTTHCFPSYYW